jgi:hypothetical protein
MTQIEESLAPAAPPGADETQSPPRSRRVSKAPADPAPKRRGAPLAVVGGAGAGLLVLLLGVLNTQPVETLPDPWHPTRVLVYALLLAGPGLVFWALGRALGLGLFWVFGTLAWAALGGVLIFWPPPPRAAAGPGDYLLLLALLFLALVAAFTPPLFWVSARLAHSRLARRDLHRPLRQAILLALFLVAWAVMGAFGVSNWLNVLLLFTVLALAEFFFLSRG